MISFIIGAIGIVTGLSIAVLNIALWIKFHIPFQRKMEELMNKPIFISESNRAYIAGLSDEEQSFSDSINKNVDVKLD